MAYLNKVRAAFEKEGFEANSTINRSQFNHILNTLMVPPTSSFRKEEKPTMKKSPKNCGNRPQPDAPTSKSTTSARPSPMASPSSKIK